MIRKLKIKFVAINMLLITIVLSITFIAVYVNTNRRIVFENTEIMRRVIEHKENFKFPKREIGAPKSDGEYKGPPPITIFCVELDSENNITNIMGDDIIVSDETVLQKIVTSSLNNKKESGIIYGENLRFLKHNTDTGIKIAFADRDNEIKVMNSIIKASIFVGFFSLLAFFSISVFLAKWILKPTEKSWQQQKQFLADASHELKTPLTVILTNADIVLSHKKDTIENQSKWVEHIQTEAKRMSTLINELLFLAKTDDTKTNIIFSTLNFSDIVWNSLLPFESVIYEQGKILESNIESDIMIYGEENKLKQLIVILLDNACKYSNEKTTIEINLSENQDKIKLSVTNKGVPISQEDVEHIFERFYRVDKSRARENGGYGLGLSIAQSIVNMHSGKISVQSGERTIFTVIFPSIKKNTKSYSMFS